MNEFEELLNDDELVVRESALISLGQIYDVMDESKSVNFFVFFPKHYVLTLDLPNLIF